MIWAGNFNRHHPLWDDEKDTHLFTQQALNQASNLIELIATYKLNMPFPKGILTLQHMVTKKYSCLDNFFVTNGLLELITKCEVNPTTRPPFTNHFPIVTNIQLSQKTSNTSQTYNFKNTNWTIFRSKLHDRLKLSLTLIHIQHPKQIKELLDKITQSIQTTITETVTLSKPRPDTKR